MRPHGTQEQLEQRRRRAVEMLQNGMSLSAISKKLHCSPSSVHLWRDIHRRKGDEGLNPKPIPGRPSRMDHRQKKALIRLLIKGPLSCGYVTDLWTTRLVTEVIRKKFGIDYHPNHLWYLLQGLGFSCQKPDEWVWNHLKRAVANSVPKDLPDLRRLLKSPVQKLKGSQKLLWSCLRASDLPWP